jgi:hypothetical protein
MNFGDQIVRLVEVRGNFDIYRPYYEHSGYIKKPFPYTTKSDTIPSDIPPHGKSHFDMPILTNEPINMSDIQGYQLRLNWR